MRILFGVVLGHVCLTFSSATADCTDIISLSKETASTVQSKSQIEEQARQFCNDYASSRGNSASIQARASYKLFAASLGVATGSVEQIASKYCDAQQQSARRSDSYRSYIESIAPGTYEAYQTCVSLQGDNVQVSIQRNGILAKEMFVNITYSSLSRQAPSHTVKWSASDGVSCSWNDDSKASVSITIPAGTSALLHCRRTSDTRRDVVSAYVTSRANSMVTIPWSAFFKDVPVDYLAALHKQISDISNELVAARDAHKNELAKVASRIPRVEQGSANMGDTNEGGCPPRDRGNLAQRISFATAFVAPPKVVASITHLDANPSKYIRIKVVVKNVDEKGFTYDLATWCNSHVSGAQMTWTAIGS